MNDKPSSASRRPNHNEAQIRTNLQSGHEFIYVERSEVALSADMTEADAQALENARPTKEEIRRDRWSED